MALSATAEAMNRSSHDLAARGKGGFALPSVLFVVAMATLVLLVAIEALATLAVETRRVRQGAAFEAEARSLEARTTLLAATRPLGPNAILANGQPKAAALIVLDGRPYWAGPNTVVSAQDEAGLVNLDGAPSAALPRLFAALGAPAGWQAAMADRTADYLDPSDLKRPQGADASDYAARGLPAPPKAPLVRLDQIEGVLGWDAVIAAPAWRAFRDNVTADPSSSAVNVNTAPAGALEVIYGFTPAQARLAVARRAATPFFELEDLGRAAGVSLHGDAERVYTMPNGRFALRVEDSGAGLAYRARLLLSPDDPARPFWVVEPQASQLTATERASLPQHAPVFPQAAD
jgi:type II secretory pathway component PulK